MKVAQILKNRPIFARVVFAISFVVSLALFVAGFCVPPYGVIDGSVLTAGGILLGFATFSMLPDLVASGKSATIEHGDTRITLGKHSEENEQ